MKSETTEQAMINTMESLSHSLTNKSVMAYLHQISGQEKRHDVIEVDHSYAKPWNRHPDALIRAKAAKFVFMKNFPRHFMRRQTSLEAENVIDVERLDAKPTLPILNGINFQQPFKTTLNESDANTNELPSPPKNGWTTQMNKLWTKAMKILHSDRLARLSYEGQTNEAVLKRNLSDRSSNKFRHLFATAGWDINLVQWLNNTLNDYVGPLFLASYHDSMQILRTKIPTLIDKFYIPPKCDTQSRLKQVWDPIQTMLNNYKLKRINGSPLFLIVPNGPHIPHQMTSQRMKHWHNLFGAMGKVISINVIARPYETTFDLLNEIRYSVRDKIKECKTTFNEGRPLVLVGFGHSSLIAAHCALDNAPHPKATICLGFPLTAINGFRGDLDDPLLETTVPTLFIIGQNSTMATLDDMEDFRERITKTETGLVVVGGANDRLIISSYKKKFDGITQSMVDRSIAEEIYEFVSDVLNKNSTVSDYSSFQSVSGINRNYMSPNKSSKGADSTASKSRKRRNTRDRDRSRARSRRPKTEKIDKKPEIINPVTNTINGETGVIPAAETPSKSSASLPPSDDNAVAMIKSEMPNTPNTPIAPFVLSLSEKLSSNEIACSKASAVKTSETPITTAVTTPIATSTVTSTPSQSQTNAAKIERHYGMSYDVSELPTFISKSATRTGRQIRAPKSLDV